MHLYDSLLTTSQTAKHRIHVKSKYLGWSRRKICFNCNYLLPIPLADKDSASADHTYEGNLSTWSFYDTAYYQVSIPFDVLRVEPKSSTRCRHVYLSPVSLFLIEHKTAKRLGSKVDHEAGTIQHGG